MIILFSSKNEASNNIAINLIKQGFVKKDTYWEYKNSKLIDTMVDSILDVPTDFTTDCIVVLSTHRSRNYRPMLTCHPPGNWNSADLGGEPKTLNTTPASVLKSILLKMKGLVAKELPDFEVQMEVDHHGPTCSVPILYLEIGPTEKEFLNEVAGSIAARALITAINSSKAYDAGIAIGGGHYPEKFNKLIFDPTEPSLAHVLPKYKFDSLDDKMFKQAVEKSVEPVKKAFVRKNEFNSSERDKIKERCERHKIEYVEI